MAAAATGSRKPRAEINNMAHLQTTRNCLLLLLLVAAALVSLCGASFHYEAPSDCQWTLMNSSVSLPSSSSAAGGTLTSSGVGSTGHSSLPMVGGGGGGVVGANDVALHCRLRTINSQFDQTNFSVVPREHTASLTIECSDSLLYQRYVLWFWRPIK